MIVKELHIIRKPYLPPRIEFEELEEDERDMLLASKNDGTGTNPSTGIIETPGGGNRHSMDIGFDLDLGTDFVINDEL